MKTPYSEIEKIRDELISSLIEARYDKINILFEKLFNKMETDLSENDQKAVNQIVHAFKTLQEKSYGNSIYKKVLERLKNQVKREIRNPDEVEYDMWLEKTGISEEYLKTVIKNLSSLQITTGCSNFCRRCNEWALPFPRKHFSFEAVRKFLLLLREAGNRNFSLYCASDPLDWKAGDKDISDIEDLLEKLDFFPEFGILTKVPHGKEEVLRKLIKKGSDFGVSITEKNRKRIEKAVAGLDYDLYKQHDLDELTIAAGLDEDFSTIKPSITDSYGIEITCDGVFQIIPTFTSALSLTGQARIPVNENDKIVKQVTGREALRVQYFKPLPFLDLNGKTSYHDELLSPQIENILLDRGDGEIDPPGMMNLKEFFRSFGEKAVLSRRKILPSVISEAEREMGAKSQRFKVYKENYIRSCDVGESDEMRLDAVFFLLKEVKRYMKENPHRRKIVLHLRRDEIKNVDEKYDNEYKNGIIKTLKECDEDGFELFEILLLKLVKNPDFIDLEEFIDSEKYAYNSIADRFFKKV